MQHYATKGRYKAQFCTTIDRLVQNDGGPVQCITDGSLKCIELPFDFPSSIPVVGALGCSNVDDRCIQDSDCCAGPDNGANGQTLHCFKTAGTTFCGTLAL
jgi:hypothetical protein